MFNVPDLRRRIFFTLGLLAVYRLGAHIGAPGINKARLDQFGAMSLELCWACWICFQVETFGRFQFSL
jgi:preprotein translocase subunit SecY